MKINEEPFYYYIVYKCLNCGHREELSFKKGVLAPSNQVLCSNCECEKMVKVMPNGS